MSVEMSEWIGTQQVYAAWFQGIGTVVAVLIAIAVPYLDRWHNRGERRRSANAAIEYSRIAMVNALDCMANERSLRGEATGNTVAVSLRLARTHLSAIDGTGFGPDALVKIMPLHSFLDAIEGELVLTKSKASDPAAWAEYVADIPDRRSRGEGLRKLIHETAEEAQAQFRGHAALRRLKA